MKVVNYLVVTIPPKYREDFKEHSILSAFRRALVRKLKSLGFERGLSRWHWAGDCKHCDSGQVIDFATGEVNDCTKCKGTGAAKGWHPHLNILLETGYMKEISTVKNFCAKWLRNNLGGSCSRIVAHTQYFTAPEKKAHVLSYVTRATLRHPIVDLIEKVKGYRNSHTWGKWEKEGPAKSEGAALENGCCPHCKERINWKEEEGLPTGFKGNQDFLVYTFAHNVGTRVTDLGYLEIKPRPPSSPSMN